MVNSKRSRAAKQGWITRRANAVATGKSFVGAVKIAANESTPLDLTTAVMTSWFDDKGMNQIYSTGLEFSWVSPEGKQCHPFAFCKDYLQDAVWATINNQNAGIYGFYYVPGTNPVVDFKATRVAVRLKGDQDFKSKCLKSLNFMRAIEADQGFDPSRLEYGGKYKDGTDEVYVLVGDVRWMYSPTLISLYTLAVRVGMTYEEGSWREHFENAKSYIGSNDAKYTTRAKAGLDKVIGKPITEIFASKFEDNYPADAGIYGLHDHSGIVSLSEGRVDAAVKKNW